MEDQIITMILQTGVLILKMKKKETSISFACHLFFFFSPPPSPDALPDFQLGVINSSLVLCAVYAEI